MVRLGIVILRQISVLYNHVGILILQSAVQYRGMQQAEKKFSLIQFDFVYKQKSI